LLSVIQQLVNPNLDIAFSKHVREGNRAALRILMVRSVATIAPVALVGVLAAIGIALLTLPGPPTPGDLGPSFFVGACGYWIFLALQSPMDRLLILMGRTSIRLAWDVARTVSLVGAFLLVDGSRLLASIGIITCAAVTIYFGLALYAIHDLPQAAMKHEAPSKL
jgi:O-antigen/teichoic acid export membrane protein